MLVFARLAFRIALLLLTELGLTPLQADDFFPLLAVVTKLELNSCLVITAKKIIAHMLAIPNVRAGLPSHLAREGVDSELQVKRGCFELNSRPMQREAHVV